MKKTKKKYKLSPEHRKKISEARKGIPVSQKTKNKMSVARKKYFSDPKNAEKIKKMYETHGRPVEQKLSSGKWVRFQTASLAAKEAGTCRQLIQMVCSKKYINKTAGGYTWRYAKI